MTPEVIACVKVVSVLIIATIALLFIDNWKRGS